ncbi:MAG TPA: GFA family protein [Polyangiaceae bacterium]
MEKRYEGGCHCGRVRFRALVDLDECIECNCSICSKKGILHAIIPLEKFELSSGEDALSTYTFGTGMAKHTFCRHCGIHAFYVPRSDPDKIDVNVRCLDGVDLSRVTPKPFDGRNWEDAQAARER